MASCGNLLDPDKTRDMLSCIGYTRLNVFDYREAGWVIDSVVFIRLMDRAEKAGNKTILFTMGMYGCGKTTSINNNPEIKKLSEEVGVISEGAYSNVASFDDMVAKSGARGFEPHVLYVYNDAVTGFTNCMERLIRSNRAVRYQAYISVFPQFKGRVEYLQEHYPGIKLYCLDNSHNSGGIRVTPEQAKKWDYTMSEDLEQKLNAIEESYIESGRLTPEQQLRYAKVAEDTKCDMFIAGCEMVMSERREKEWRQLIKDIRSVYSGLVSYNTDKYQEHNVKWWDAVDVISSSGYYPVDNWEEQLDRIEKVVKKFNKPFFFSEMGCMSTEGSKFVPNNWCLDGDSDLEGQKEWYTKMIAACDKRDWVEGYGYLQIMLFQQVLSYRS